MNTFRKSKSGEWVVQGSPSDVSVGKCRVERKDGSTRFVQVVEVGRPFVQGGQSLVYGYLTAREPQAQKAAQDDFFCGFRPGPDGTPAHEDLF